jgi:hypothetical protein
MLAAAALVALPAACNKDNDAANRAEQAAERVQDTAEDLREEREDLAEEVRDRADRDDHDDLVEDPHDRVIRDRDGRAIALPDRPVDHSRKVAERVDRTEDAEAVIDEARDVSGKAVEVATAAADFESRRDVRVRSLRARHAVIASQPMLIHTLGASAQLTERARANLDEKLQIFQMRVDEAGNAVESLNGIDAARWETRDGAASDAISRLDDSREEAWEALTDGERIGPST